MTVLYAILILGVLGLLFYMALMVSLLSALFGRGMTVGMLVAADTACKCISSTITWFLPYARSEAEAKNGLVYTPTSVAERVGSLLAGLLPMGVLALFGFGVGDGAWWKVPLSLTAPIAVAACLFRLMRRRIGGYTGDCCGATFLLTELAFYMVLLLLSSH